MTIGPHGAGVENGGQGLQVKAMAVRADVQRGWREAPEAREAREAGWPRRPLEQDRALPPDLILSAVEHLLGRVPEPPGLQRHTDVLPGIEVASVVTPADRERVFVVVAREQAPRPNDLTGIPGLTPREAQVALLLAARRTNKEIARELGMTPKTASRYTEDVMAKLGVSCRRHVEHALTSAQQRKAQRSVTGVFPAAGTPDGSYCQPWVKEPVGQIE